MTSEPANHNSDNARQPANQQHPEAPAGAGQVGGTNVVRSPDDVDAIMRAISDLHSGLTGLRQIRAETTRLETEMAAKRMEMESWEKRLKVRAEEAEKERNSLSHRAKEIQDRQTAIGAERHSAEVQAREIAAQRQELAAKASKLELRGREVEARDGELKNRQREVEDRAKRLESEKSTLEQRTQALAIRHKELSELGSALETQRKELDARRDALERQRQDLSQRASTLDAQRQELEEKGTRLESLRAEAEKNRGDVGRTQAEVAARSAELNRARAELDAARPVIESQRAEVAREREQATALRKNAESFRRESAEAAETRTREIAAREAELTAREAKCKQAERDGAEIVAQATRKREEAVAGAQRAMARADALQRELDGLRSGTTSASEVANEALDRTRQEAAAASQRAEEAVARASQLEAAAGAVREETRREVEELAARVAEAASVREGLEGRLAALESELREASGSLEQARAQLDDARRTDPDEIEKRNRAIETLRKQLEEARQWGEMLEAELEAAKSGAASPDQDGQGRAPAARPARSLVSRAEEWVHRRRERLVRYKGLLQAQARKIITAKDALAKRQQECDQVLAQRGKLAQAVETIRNRERQLAARRARTGAAAAIFYALGSVVILGSLSWTVTNQVVPATYIASAVIEADLKGRPAAEGELAGWQQYHQDLVTDPRLIEAAADRFAKRGITKLGTAPELGSRLRRDMTFTSSKPGSLKIELRGKGMDRTQRELDTFVTAVASVANTARGTRTDGLPTTISQAAQVAHDPVEDPRPAYALGVAGGGLVAIGLLGYMVWGRLSRGKNRYEEEQKVGEAMGNLTWGDVPQGKRL